jgi:hypothetical protein
VLEFRDETQRRDMPLQVRRAAGSRGCTVLADQAPTLSGNSN